MNVALIFAGGVGKRMHSGATPKQFLTLRGKPILAYTLEHFQYSDEIDAIVLVSVEDWIPKCKEILEKYKLTKVCSVVPGGKTGFLSIDNGLKEIHRLFPDDSVVLIHDGVRPLINSQVIADCVKSTKKYGNAITVSPAIETIIIQDKDNNVENIFDRNVCQIAKAPQCFILADILFLGFWILNYQRGFDGLGLSAVTFVVIPVLEILMILLLGGYSTRKTFKLNLSSSLRENE